MLNVHFRLTRKTSVNSELSEARAATMSAGVVNLQAQVESVLAALVKAASVELLKLFESRSSAVDVGHTGRKEEDKTSEDLDVESSNDSKRSIGVQVEKDICLPLELAGSTFFQDVGCLGDSSEVVVDGFLMPPEILQTENTHADLEWPPPKDQIIADSSETVELSGPEAPVEDAAQTEDISDETDPETLRVQSTHSSSDKQKLLVIQPDTSGSPSGQKVKFVCPLILKTETSVPKLDHLEEPVQAEPQQACVSTAKGTAYSPSPSDGAVTPTPVGMWERICTPKETKNHLHMKLKFTSHDQKLLRPCAVQLVDMLKIPESEVKNEGDAGKAHIANHNSGWPFPKDLRRHQGPHTGHRLCCFTQSGSGVWHLQKIVTHSRDGYICSICKKAFKRRKILRRHERFHTGEKPYPCSVCSKTFALRKSLRRHLRFHTGERPHDCTQCGKSFRLRDNLKAHLRFHSGEKPFSCSTCGKMFRIMRNLEKHKVSQCESFVPSFRKIAGL